MYGIYANIGGILMANVTIYSIHGSYGFTYYIFISKANGRPMMAQLLRKSSNQFELVASRHSELARKHGEAASCSDPTLKFC
jgi:hypothetical protein